MSIEQKIEVLIASIDKNTAALIALSNSPVATVEELPPVKPTATVKEQKQNKAAVERVKATEAAAVDEPKGETVGSVIEAMLKVNKRKEAIALLAKFNAKSASGIDATQADAFIEQANEILLSA